MPRRLRGGAGALPPRAGAARRARGGPAAAVSGGGREGRVALATSAATHAVLPLLATRAGLRLQLDAGIRSHRRRFGWGGGFWLPECAYVPGLEWRWPSTGCAGSASTRAPTRRRSTRWRRSRPRPARWRCRSTGRRSSGCGRSTAIPPIPPTPSSPASRCAGCGSGRSAAGRTTRRRPRRGARQAGEFLAAVAARLREFSRARGRRGPARLRDRHRAARALVVGGGDLAARGAGRRRRRGGPPADRPRGARRARAGRRPLRGLDLGRGQGPAHLGLARRRRPRLGRAAAGAAGAAGALGRPARRRRERAARELLAVQASDWAFLDQRGQAGDYAYQRAIVHADAALEAIDSPPRRSAPARLAPDLSLAPC